MISVGIDVSKGKSMICMLKPYGEVLLSPNEISHTQEEIIDVVAKIKSYDEE
ncbi:MAG: transposase, partial [Oscillospiraceae bacterium]